MRKGLGPVVALGVALAGLFSLLQVAVGGDQAASGRPNAARTLLEVPQSSGGRAGGGRLAPDFVVAIPTSPHHVEVARASRAWRKGARTFIASAEPLPPAEAAEAGVHNETWGVYPDDAPLRWAVFLQWHSLAAAALRGTGRA